MLQVWSQQAILLQMYRGSFMNTLSTNTFIIIVTNRIVGKFYKYKCWDTCGEYLKRNFFYVPQRWDYRFLLYTLIMRTRLLIMLLALLIFVWWFFHEQWKIGGARHWSLTLTWCKGLPLIFAFLVLRFVIGWRYFLSAIIQGIFQKCIHCYRIFFN
jgi:hypothetical protein